MLSNFTRGRELGVAKRNVLKTCVATSHSGTQSEVASWSRTYVLLILVLSLIRVCIKCLTI
uniref:Uncharacterized protein n=1 Tax=Triticum urartu TaxID=4572 RepID=A0A8R7VDQ8_TRIUA